MIQHWRMSWHEMALKDFYPSRTQAPTETGQVQKLSALRSMSSVSTVVSAVH